MDCTVTTSPANTQTADVLIACVPAGLKALPKSLKPVDHLVGGWIAQDIADGALEGKRASVQWYRPSRDAGVKHVLVVGTGPAAELDATAVRKAAYAAFRAVIGKKQKRVVLQLFGRGRKAAPADVAAAWVEGALLATFNPKNWVTGEDAEPVEVETLVVADAPSGGVGQVRKAVERGRILGEAGNLTKFLQNEPANAMTPQDLAKHARRIGKAHGLDVKVLSRAQCEKLGMGSFVSVSHGSAQPPQFLVLRYTGRRKSQTLALVGKGVTFDTGGISIKPSAGMEEMKYDMSGAATVLGAMQAIAQLKPAVNVVGICPCTENMPSGASTKPGDIVKAMNGKTIEVINTDAEGRLILADALCYAVKQAGATQLVDLATLTGACIVALGHEYAAVMTNDAAWGKTVLAAAAAAGEKAWELPMDSRYGELIKSKIADIKNVGNREAGTIIGAKFLEHFVGDTPWVHLDIAGVAWVDRAEAGLPTGATAAPMRTLVTLAMTL